jgi:hypothetical protein
MGTMMEPFHSSGYSSLLQIELIIQINHQPGAMIFQFIILTFIYSSTCFRGFPARHQELDDCSGSLWFCLRIVVTVVLCSWSDRTQTQHDCHHDTKVKSEAATAVVELLMMGGETPETCWAVNERQDNKLENHCTWLVIYLDCTMMHGLTNLNLLAPEFYVQILAHPVCKIWIIQEPKNVALWNKRHFEDKNGECAACLKYSVLIFVEKIYIKCNIWRVAVRPSYIEDARFLTFKNLASYI